MTWRSRNEVPEIDEPVLLMLDDDAGTAIRHGDDWYLFDPQDPGNIRQVEPGKIRGWQPLPKTEQEREQLRSNAQQLFEQTPERRVDRARADLMAIRSELAAVEQAEAAAARQAAADDARRQADDDERAAERERHRQWQQLFERK
jgi:hypothetical protein